MKSFNEYRDNPAQFPIATHMVWESNLEPEDLVQVRWMSNGRRYSAEAILVRKSKASLTVELLEEVGSYPAEKTIKVPSTNPLGSGLKNWSTTNGVFPITGRYPVDLFQEDEEHLIMEYGERANPRKKETMSLEEWVRQGWGQTRAEEEEDEEEDFEYREAARNPTLSCPNCGSGNKDSRTTCWKCGFEIVQDRTKPYFGAPLKRRTTLGRYRRNP